MMRRTPLPRFYFWFGYKSEVCPKEFAPSYPYRALDLVAPRPSVKDFDFELVLADALKVSDMAAGSQPEIGDAHWWKKLCSALSEKGRSNYGGQLLRRKLVGAMSNRLLVDQWHRVHAEDLAAAKVLEPIIVMGLPRSQGHMVAHITSRTGHVTPLRCRDTMFPGVPNQMERRRLAKKELRGMYHVHPYMQAVRNSDADLIDDDLQLHLQTPFSLAWGLLFGLPEYLYECIDQDQTAVYEQVKKNLLLFDYYGHCGQYTDGVLKEIMDIDNPMNQVADGPRITIEKKPFLWHSPLAVLNAKQVHQVFPDCRLIWVHRSIDQIVPSLCSALSARHSMYTGRLPSDQHTSSLGEIVCGMFGSGSANAIDYLGANFPYERMVHWHNKDVTRSCTRLVEKTFIKWGMEMDTFRMYQCIDGMTEYHSMFRPHHDHEIAFFALHEGTVTENFDAYFNQFAEYAYEKKFGMVIQDYQSLSNSFDETKLSYDANREDEGRQTNMEHMFNAGHMLAVPAGVRPHTVRNLKIDGHRAHKLPTK
jgi:hypothetical protein